MFGVGLISGIYISSQIEKSIKYRTNGKVENRKDQKRPRADKTRT